MSETEKALLFCYTLMWAETILNRVITKESWSLRYPAIWGNGMLQFCEPVGLLLFLLITPFYEFWVVSKDLGKILIEGE